MEADRRITGDMELGTALDWGWWRAIVSSSSSLATEGQAHPLRVFPPVRAIAPKVMHFVSGNKSVLPVR